MYPVCRADYYMIIRTLKSCADFVEYAFLHMDKDGNLKDKRDLATAAATDLKHSSALQ